MAELPEELLPYAAQVFELIDSVFSRGQLPDIGDDRNPKTNPLNATFDKQEFKARWNRQGIARRRSRAAPGQPPKSSESYKLHVAVVMAIEALPERERPLHLLQSEHDLNQKEIAVAMGVTEGRTSQFRSPTVARIRAKLKG